jgi:hypothetical protein
MTSALVILGLQNFPTYQPKSEIARFYKTFEDGVLQVGGIVETETFEMSNATLVSELISEDSTVNYYYRKSGSPFIIYIRFCISDAIASKLGIGINIGKRYSPEEMKKILIKQFGCYYGLSHR